jgi:DNA-binding beta-propeller fold protein YncE
VESAPGSDTGRAFETAAGSGTTGPARLAFHHDRVFVTEAGAGTLAVIDRGTRRLLRRMPTGGQQPTGLAVTRDGFVLVCNRFSGGVALIDPIVGRSIRQRELLGEPTEAVVSRDGTRAFVTVAQRDELAVLSLPDLKLVKRIVVGRRPRALALSPNGETLLVASHQGGDVWHLDAASLEVLRRIPTTGVNLRAVAFAPTGSRAYVSGQIPANTRITAEPLDIWTNTLFALDLSAPERSANAEGWLDFADAPSPDPGALAVLEDERVAVALQGSDEVLLVRTPGPHLRTYDPKIERRTRVGWLPGALAVSPDGRELWVANELGSSISVLARSDLRLLQSIALGSPSPRPADSVRLQGRRIFASASRTLGGQFSCASCHPDTKADGLTWEFNHVRDGLTRRNTRFLRGGITGTAPFRWSGEETTVEEFVQNEFVGLLQGPRQPHDVLHAVWLHLDQADLPPNPYRDAGQKWTAAGRRGKQLFEGEAGCSACHAGELAGGTGMRAHVGTSAQPLDVPHLRGCYDSAPYLHDGRAATLEAIFSRHNPHARHGKASELTPTQLADLLEYVREL